MTTGILNIKLTASLVLYNNRPEVFIEAIESYLRGSNGLLVVIDNSETEKFNPIFKNNRIIYIFNNKNIGFGAAHNKAFSFVSHKSDFHLFLNPDISFGNNVIDHLLSVLLKNSDIGSVMPMVKYRDGSLQYLCKLLPTPFALFVRRFSGINFFKNIINSRYELHNLSQKFLVDVPSLSGCFLLVRSELLRITGGFDNRFFMYFEDVDLVRRINDYSRVCYDPRVCIFHDYAKGSYKSIRLLSYHIKSALYYFSKWGWFFDPIRSERNSNVIFRIKNFSDQ